MGGPDTLETSERTVTSAPATGLPRDPATVPADDRSAIRWRPAPRPNATDGDTARGTSPGSSHEASRTRLLGALVVWDALLAVALLPICAQLEGTELNGGAASPLDPLALFLAIASVVGLAIAGG